LEFKNGLHGVIVEYNDILNQKTVTLIGSELEIKSITQGFGVVVAVTRVAILVVGILLFERRSKVWERFLLTPAGLSQSVNINPAVTTA